MTGWTREKPTEPGWYWWRDGDEPFVAQLVLDDGEVQVEMDDGWRRDLPETGEWYGPIQPPGAPLTEEEKGRINDRLQVIYVDAERVERLKNPDCLSLSATVFRLGGTVNQRKAEPFVAFTPAVREAIDAARRASTAPPLTDEEATVALDDINRTFPSVGRIDRWVGSQFTVPLSGDFDLPTLRAIVAILERVAP